MFVLGRSVLDDGLVGILMSVAGSNSFRGAMPETGTMFWIARTWCGTRARNRRRRARATVNPPEVPGNAGMSAGRVITVVCRGRRDWNSRWYSMYPTSTLSFVEVTTSPNFLSGDPKACAVSRPAYSSSVRRPLRGLWTPGMAP